MSIKLKHFASWVAATMLLTTIIAPVSADVVVFNLGSPSINGSVASFGISLSFSGAPGDQLEVVQLSVLGSDPSLTANGTDFGRFSFSLSSVSPLVDWSSAGVLALSGVELLFPLDPLLGPFIVPGATPVELGTLKVDLTGISPNVGLLVTLGGGTLGLGTDAGGTIGGFPIPSIAADSDSTINFANPNGVSFVIPGAAVPEPATFAVWLAMGVGGLAIARLRRRTRRDNS